MSRARDVQVTEDRLTVELTDGRRISVPLSWFPRLQAADPKARQDWRLLADRSGMRWPEIDEHVSVHSLRHPEETIPSREIREQEEGRSPVREGDHLLGWDDGKGYFYVAADDPLRPLSGYCVSHDPEMVDRLVDVCRDRLRELDPNALPPRPGPGDMRPWPPASE